MNPRYPLVAARAGHRCEYCRAPEVVFNLPFEVEHVVPPVHGGAPDADANLALACRACNLHKSAFLTGDDPESRTPQRLFNPRIDVWSAHFAVVAESDEIRGLSPVGRATIERLRLNAAARLPARRLWRQLGLLE